MRLLSAKGIFVGRKKTAKIIITFFFVTSIILININTSFANNSFVEKATKMFSDLLPPNQPSSFVGFNVSLPILIISLLLLSGTLHSFHQKYKKVCDELAELDDKIRMTVKGTFELDELTINKLDILLERHNKGKINLEKMVCSLEKLKHFFKGDIL